MDLMREINGYISDLLEDIREDGRYDEEAAGEKAEVMGWNSMDGSEGYDMTPEENTQYMELLKLSNEVLEFERQFFKKVHRIVKD